MGLMPRKSGYIVKYKDRTGLAHHKEQTTVGKAMVHWVDDDSFKPIIKDGKPWVTIVNSEFCRIIGMWD